MAEGTSLTSEDDEEMLQEQSPLEERWQINLDLKEQGEEGGRERERERER